MAKVSGSALPTKYRVIAAAVPPRELDTIASRTPIPSPTIASYRGHSIYVIIRPEIIDATT
jgi:hypothetical protein